MFYNIFNLYSFRLFFYFLLLNHPPSSPKLLERSSSTVDKVPHLEESRSFGIARTYPPSPNTY